MNKLDILLQRWKVGVIRDPDLFLCLKTINDYRLEALNHGTNIPPPEGVRPVLREVGSTDNQRPEAEGLRAGPKGRTTRNNPKDSGTL